MTMAQAMAVVPFAPKIVQLVEARIRVEDMNAQRAAATITEVTKEIARLTATPPRVNREQAMLGATAVEQLRAITTEWFNFYNGYDPLFTWWMGMPYEKVDEALKDYAALLRDKVAAENLTVPASAPRPPIRSPPAARRSSRRSRPRRDHRAAPGRDARHRRALHGRGRRARRAAAAAAEPPATSAFYTSWLAALKSLDFDTLSRNAQVDYLFIRRTAETQIARANLKLDPNPPRKPDNERHSRPGARPRRADPGPAEAMIPYTPEQLIALAEKEFAWCDHEMLKASREMGFGDDWKKAVEKTKTRASPPGGQPRMIMDLLDEAVDYLRANDLITVPQVAAESLHMIMMSPERQLVNPFFLGGGQISVSYPTDTMEYDARMQSMRGNNPGFSHATAFHEMIPGHNLVGYLSARFADYRANLTAAARSSAKAGRSTGS